MQLSAYGKQTNINDALRENTDKSFLTIVRKYCANPAEGNVCVTHKGKCIKADISGHVGKGNIVQSNFSSKEHQKPVKEHSFIVTKKAIQVERRSLSEAVMRMDLMGQAAFLSRNRSICATNIVCMRNYDKIGGIGTDSPSQNKTP